MYGKFFASTFTGSMFGAGPVVFAVWGYVIANTVDARVELNPKLLASILGTTEDAVTQAIDELCQPDPCSRNPDAEGRRLQREGVYQFRVTSHEIYRAIKSEEERRLYNRKKQQESRLRKQVGVKRNVNDITSMSTPSAHTDLEAEADLKADHSSDLASSSVLASSENKLARSAIEAQNAATLARVKANYVKKHGSRKGMRHVPFR